MISIAPAKAAVLVIDVQVGLFCTTPPPFEAAEVITRINIVTGKARRYGVPVVFVQNDGPPDGDWLVPHAAGWELHPELNRSSADPVVRKSTGDVFYKTDLERTLRSAGVQSVVLMGYATDFCIDSSLRNAVSKEFEIYMVSDGHTTNDAPMMKAPVIREYFNWVWADSPSRFGIHVLPAARIEFCNGAVCGLAE